MSVLSILIATMSISFAAARTPTVTVGSKVFTESYILAEMIAQIIESTGEAKVDRKFGMGATGILYEAVRTGAIDIYPEYSGTISEAILKDPSVKSLSQIQKQLRPHGLMISDSLGFNNTYALGVNKGTAERLGLRVIGDLVKTPDLRLGFSYEFMNRPDGFKALMRAYGLNLKHVRSMEHSLAYEALARGEIEATDVYSTDAKIEKLGLALLEDNKSFFPKYYGVLLARSDFAKKFPKSWDELQNRLGNSIAAAQMIKLNAEADLEKKSFPEIASRFLNLKKPSVLNEADFTLRLRQHLVLVLGSLMPAIIVGVPLGILSSRRRRLGKMILAVSGVLQTIPSLALLCFLIPLFGVGNPPALFALFLYALLPIVLNTFLGLTTINRTILESETALALKPLERLRFVELPLVSPNILSGIRTSAIVSIGTATLAALIGAGGYGVPIVTGLALNDIPTILSGAVPAAALALVASWFFDLLGLWVVPRALRGGNNQQ